MKLIEEQQKYLAWKLSGRNIDDGRLAGVLSEAHVDLNPHQIQAAMFALQSPFSKGVILADEVGLGKTIEAGIVISQMWSEGKRKIIIVVPASLQKQWKSEMEEKFFLPSTILRSDFNEFRDSSAQIIICSHNYASNYSSSLRTNNWDLVVIDEAHKLRNVYRAGNKLAKSIKDTFVDCRKLLLTATPLQNSIQELYGLVSIIDEQIFGDIKSFNARYGYNLIENKEKFNDLRERIAPIIHRTLRSQVEDYIKYTRRVPVMMEYTPYPEERELYTLLTEYLSNENTYGIPSGQRKLMQLVFRKVMASSSFAVAHTIKTVLDRLKNTMNQLEQISEDSTIESDLNDMFGDDTIVVIEESDFNSKKKERYTQEDIAPMKEEIKLLEAIYNKALVITKNKKGESLLKALKTGFAKMDELGAERKALIFTENKTTQNYLKALLETNNYKGKIVIFNGDNNSSDSNEIYKKWLEDNTIDYDDVTDIDINRRQALVDYFRDSANIMIATEAAAEGVNLQFCSLVINYDLPWNPQRIEQRIGRCHRYGQKHDVVVFNFLNKGNAADKRVYELLQDKFHLFDGVFGSSNEVLGIITSGTNIELKIADIYQNCRTEEQINDAFNMLQKEMEAEIEAEMTSTRQRLIDNINDDVLDLLSVQRENSNRISEYNEWLWNLTISFLGNNARIKDSQNHVFTLLRNPFSQGLQRRTDYALNSRNPQIHNYRVGNSLAQSIIQSAKHKNINNRNILVNNESLDIKEGYIALERMHYESSLHNDDKFILIAMDANGNSLPDEYAEKLIDAALTAGTDISIPPTIHEKKENIRQQRQKILTKSENQLLETLCNSEIVKIDKWTEDQYFILDKAIEDAQTKRQEAKRNRDRATTEVERRLYQNLMESCDTPIQEARRAKFKKTNKIKEEAEKMKEEVKRQIKPTITSENIFFVHWQVNN